MADSKWWIQNGGFKVYEPWLLIIETLVLMILYSIGLANCSLISSSVGNQKGAVIIDTNEGC